jgi:hypothetical protein
MSATYDDLMIRDYFGDNGSPRTGNLSGSPDIIPWGTDPIPADYQTFFTTTPQVNQDLGKDVVGFQANTLFVRTLNQATGAASGKVYLYYSPSNLLMAPGLWSQNVLNTVNGAGYGNVSATQTGQYSVGDSPFIWVPQPPPNNSHFCMVARLETAAHPNPIPTNVSTYDQFVSYIATTPGTAWRNVTFVGNVPDWSKTWPMTGLSASAMLYFQVQCVNVPIGSQISFASGDPGANPPINLQPTTISTNPNFSAGIWTTIDANWSGNITVNWFSNGQGNWGPNASIILKSFYTPPGGSAGLQKSIAHHFRPATFHGIHEVPDALVGSGPVPIFNIGSGSHKA